MTKDNQNKNRQTIISVSSHPCPFNELEKYINETKNAGADFVHCDLMEQSFVNSTALGFEQLVEIGRYSTLPMDVHLMASQPEDYFDACLEADATSVTVHIESFNSIDDLKVALNRLQKSGIHAGIALNPATPLTAIYPILEYVDLVLVMTVVPGASGQAFMVECVEKISALKKLRQENGFHYLIEVDGGINATTAPLAINAGADMLVSGSYLYKSPDKKIAIDKLRGKN